MKSILPNYFRDTLTAFCLLREVKARALIGNSLPMTATLERSLPKPIQQCFILSLRNEIDPMLSHTIGGTLPSSGVDSLGYRDQPQKDLVVWELGHGQEVGWHHLRTPHVSGAYWHFCYRLCCGFPSMEKEVSGVGDHHNELA